MRPKSDARFLDSFYAQPLLGVDEVGLGCIAGPVYAAGVMLPADKYIRDALLTLGLKDSKKLSPAARERIHAYLVEQSVYMIVSSVTVDELEELGHDGGLDLLYHRIMKAYRVEVRTGTILLDGYSRPSLHVNHTGLVKADDRVLAVAAASVVAKVERDAYMTRLSRAYPDYDWENNMGYPTPKHLGALYDIGPCDEHRRNTKPVRRAIASRESLQEEDAGG